MLRLFSFIAVFLFSVCPAFASSDAVDFELIPGRYMPGADIAYAGLSISMKDGWHVYWKSPGEGGLPPEFKITSAQNLSALDVEWPMPEQYETSGAISFGYDGDVVLPLKLKPTTPSDPIFIDVDLTMYGCSDICVAFRKKLTVVVTAETSDALSEQTTRWLTAVPSASNALPLSAELSGDGQRLLVDLSATAWKPGSTPILDMGADYAARFVGAEDHSVAHFELRKVSDNVATVGYNGLLMVETNDRTTRSYAIALSRSPPQSVSPMILLIALGAGLILNVMPCVLPVLAIKLAGFTKEHAKRRQSFLWTGIGIVSSFAGLAVLVLFLKAGGQIIGWGIQFQSPGFLAVMATITLLFAIAILDGFMIRLPYGLTDGLSALGRGSGRTASFFQGLVATLLATPCSAPLVGTAVGFAFSASTMEMLLIFLLMGTGMALPYFIIYLVPASRRFLPKSGQWMGKLKILLALGMVATSGTLLAYLAISNLPAAGMIALVMTVFMFTMVASKRLAASMTAVLVLLALLSYPFDYGTKLIDWRPFEPTSIVDALSDDKIVLVDVTAAWCITCKVNETVAFSNSGVVERLSQPDIIAMRADWTVENTVISNYLQSFGRYGIPFTVVYSKSFPKGRVLSEILTPTSLLDAL